VSIDLTSPELGRELLKNAKGDLPIDAWRQYVLNHSYSPDPAKPWADVIYWCDQAYRSTLDPRTAVDDAFGILAGLLFCSPKRSYDELVKGIWEALSVLHEAPTRDSGYKGTASAVAELVDNVLQAGATRMGVSVVQAEGDANSSSWRSRITAAGLRPVGQSWRPAMAAGPSLGSRAGLATLFSAIVPRVLPWPMAWVRRARF
jgi:hypothetical protein